MEVKESQEMYLETIYLLKKENPAVRSVDIVEALGYAKSSVSRGVNLLVKNEYVTIDRHTGVINFTEKGYKKAQNVYDRHITFTKILEWFGADEELAEDNACRIEHVVSEDMYQIIKKYVAKKEAGEI